MRRLYTKKKTRNTLFKIVCFDIDDLPVSQIPQKAIRACMSKSSRYSLVRGKRFFRFLIHSNLLDSKYLPLHVDVIETFIGQIDDCDRGPLAVEQACAIFVKHLLEETRLRYGAIKTKYYHIRSFARFIGAKKRIEYINRDDIIGYLNHLEIDRGYSQASKATVLTSIRRFFAFFAAQGLMKANVTANITIKKVKKVDKTALCEEDLARVFEAAYLEYQRYEDIINPDSTETQKRWLAARNWAIICLLICTGVRRKEIMSLKTDSIDFAQRVIRIEGKGDNRHHIRQRTIPVTEPIALSAAEIYLSLRPKSIFDYFFLSNHLEPLREQGFACVVEHMKQQLFPQRSLTITQIRKSFVSLCAEKGIDPLVLRQIMGHKSLATTMKYYLTVREQHLRELWEQNNPLLYFSEKEFEQWTI